MGKKCRQTDALKNAPFPYLGFSVSLKVTYLLKKTLISLGVWNLRDRITSYKNDIRSGLNTCALASHVNNVGHNINYSDTSVLKNERSYQRRIFLEMIEINNEPKFMNKRTDI